MTSKELAILLGVSPATVSMALNGKPGLNEETRNLVLENAKKYHVSARSMAVSYRSIRLLLFHHRATLLPFSTFINDVISGIEESCATCGYPLTTHTIYGIQTLVSELNELSDKDTAGIILLGTEMIQEDFRQLPKLTIPIVLLDNHAYDYSLDAVKIDNISSAFSAVNFLIERTNEQPGYLRSSYSMNNFEERAIGYEQALKYNGMSKNNTIIHDLLPSIEGAYADMSALLKEKIPLASCYFADNDMIALGAMQALSSHGLRVPEDVSIVAFDDIEMSAWSDPPLTTMHVPRHHFGSAAVKRLTRLIKDHSLFPIKIEMTANLVLRKSIR